MILGWKSCSIDFSNAFVQAKLNDPVWIHLPRGFHAESSYTKTCLKLKKSLYGLSIAPRLWYTHLFKALKECGFTPSANDPCFLMKKEMFIILYVDDAGCAYSDERVLTDLIDSLVSNGFELSKTWYDEEGKHIDLEWDTLKAKQGDLYTVLLEISPTELHTSKDLLVTDLLPSGFEIEDSELGNPKLITSTGELLDIDLTLGDAPLYTQKLDDRFVAHFSGSWDKTDIAIVTYTVRAVYEGAMTIPDAHLELMYSPAINARSSVANAIIASK